MICPVMFMSIAGQRTHLTIDSRELYACYCPVTRGSKSPVRGTNVCFQTLYGPVCPRRNLFSEKVCLNGVSCLTNDQQSGQRLSYIARAALFATAP